MPNIFELASPIKGYKQMKEKRTPDGAVARIAILGTVALLLAYAYLFLHSPQPSNRYLLFEAISSFFIFYFDDVNLDLHSPLSAEWNRISSKVISQITFSSFKTITLSGLKC